MRARVLGGLTVGGLTDVGIGSRKARTLLAALLLARGTPVRVDRLAEVLWGNAPPERPADQLGVLASRLRRVLGADAVRRAGHGYATGLVPSELIEFEARADDAQTRLAAGEVGAALAAARAALELADAGPLLGTDMGDWLVPERDALARRLAEVRLVVATGALAVGDPLAAVAAAEQALDHDPYDELALRALLRAHVAVGRPAAALAAFARFRARLADDLGADPAPETTQLHARILRGEERPTAGIARSQKVTGRDAELAQLDRLLDTGTLARTIVVVGEPGIGKTALLDAFLTGLRGRAAVLAGRCDPMGRELPLQPLLDGLDVLLRGLGRDRAADILGADAVVIEPLLGAVHTNTAGVTVPAPADPGEALGRLFAALLRVAERAGSSPAAPVLIVVDDLHLAGPSTVEWLRFAARRSQRLRLLLATRSTVAALPDGAHRIELGPLDLAAAGRLVGDLPAGRGAGVRAGVRSRVVPGSRGGVGVAEPAPAAAPAGGHRARRPDPPRPVGHRVARSPR